ncbi:Protein prenyltransferase alpha subunit repeat-containing protein 1 [Mortierella sp. AM989]|nr:Protein prenyltransferase alpha subunit repeat-containing protein 1 [Mortierella sp. AM989]
MAAEVRLANTSITTLDPSLTKDVLYERFADILNKNEIDEIGILPFLPEVEDSTCSTLPLYPFVVQERGTKLGIPIFCWVPLLEASYAVLKDACRASIQPEWWTDPERCRQVMECTSSLMILCPDSFTAVNARKWLLNFMFKDHETVPLDPTVVEEHLKVCHLAAERYPKCYYAWTMRHWLVEHLGRYWWAASLQSRGDITKNHTQLQPLIDEFKRMKTHMQRNISDHSTHQHLQQCMVQLSGKWVVQQSHSLKEQNQQSSGSMESSETILQWTRSELATRRKKRDDWYDALEIQAYGASTAIFKSAIKSAVPDITENGEDDIDIDAGEIDWASFSWVVKLWILELRRTRSLIKAYPGHESLWYHLRFIHYGLRWLDCELDFGDNQSVNTMEREAEKGSKLFVSSATEDVFVEQLLLYEAAEGDILMEHDRQKQSQFSENYLRWVRRLCLDSTTTST